MNLLQYKSNEMFSSTELIRKSKMVFDKVSKKEIEKAVILRDGKPSFMLLDFFKYEELITEYLELKEKVKQKNTSQKEKKEEIKNFKEINDDDLKDALAQIEELDLDLKKEPRIKKKEESMKDFWE
ncbi:hypothetical protein [Poseidonibacter antarcticus]|uniref:hypothetical protein n=1 Tax=Poseidonibacter antarcticus TaxID=2478538 RepID=UPI000EF469BC|nr:hypothetical protein [Poseidonibacter antarcticus]